MGFCQTEMLRMTFQNNNIALCIRNTTTYEFRLHWLLGFFFFIISSRSYHRLVTRLFCILRAFWFIFSSMFCLIYNFNILTTWIDSFNRLWWISQHEANGKFNCKWISLVFRFISFVVEKYHSRVPIFIIFKFLTK